MNVIKQHILCSLNNIVAKYLQTVSVASNSNFIVQTPPKNIDADFALNVAMLISKKTKKPPRIVAQELANIIIKEIPELVEKVETSSAGFINLCINNEVLYKELKSILEEKDKYGSLSKNNKKRIIIEFVSANPTGPLHVGHGRGAAIGDSLARILKYLGYSVTKEYYLNDVGNQMFLLAKSTEIRYRQLKGEKIDLPADHYQGSYIIDIAKRLLSEGRSINQIDFKHESVSEILKAIKYDLEKFNIEFDNWFFESTLTNTIDKNGKTEIAKISEFFLKKGFAYIKDDILWLASTKFGDDKDRALRRSDGRYTYFASDIAYHMNKFKRGFTKLINLWGADHHGYVARIKACVQMLGFKKETLHIILYQLVSLLRNDSSVSMSTRTGEFITLRKVIDEVGKDVCRFFFLLRSPDSQLKFDLELAKKQSNENPIFYVQYVNARCNSILKKSTDRNDIMIDTKNIDFSLLNTKEERNLIKQLIAFCDTLVISEKTMSPHHLTTYLIKLADVYHKFYEKCRVLANDSNLASARLKLIESVMIIIKNCLGLLGISTIDTM
ncbi:MAG: arginine--tRNA ligase [Endomicrobium sp.]|nr:arginine--tRNA ligase [Endomicrobium sp.]